MAHQAKPLGLAMGAIGWLRAGEGEFRSGLERSLGARVESAREKGMKWWPLGPGGGAEEV